MLAKRLFFYYGLKAPHNTNGVKRANFTAKTGGQKSLCAASYTVTL